MTFSCIVHEGAQPSAVCYADHLVWPELKEPEFHLDDMIDVEPTGLNGWE